MKKMKKNRTGLSLQKLDGSQLNTVTGGISLAGSVNLVPKLGGLFIPGLVLKGQPDGAW